MKIAIAQLNPIVGDLTGNAQKIIDVAHKVMTEEVEILLTPELSLVGYPPRDLLLNPGFVDSIAMELEKLATKLPPQMGVLVGTVLYNPEAFQQGQKPLFNSMALLREGKVSQIFRKRLLPNYDVFDEDRYFQSGDESNVFSVLSQGDETYEVKIGVSICEDLWNDDQFWGKRSYGVDPILDLTQQGVNLLVNLSASPYSVGKQNLREAMLRHAAKRYNIPVIYVNQVGGNDDLIFDGCSVAFNRTGEVVSRAAACAEDVLIVDYQEDEQDLSPGMITLLATTPEAEIWSALVLGVRDYAAKCGFSRIILGLSGGIDSALVAALAADAVGASNVLAVLMPSPYSSDHSVTDSLMLVKNLGINSHKLPIETLMKGFDEVLDPVFAGTEFGIAEENIQSRIRGNLLMAIANKFGYLLLSTGNKSEMAVGYCTLYGDMNGGLAVIADVPKTRVYSLCRWLNQSGEIIPENILTKAPSAELKPGQKDQDSLPEYEILDDILERLIEKHQSLEDVIKAGHDVEVVNKVMRLLYRAEFKRRQAPPALKISPRAFGTGWRMPIASRW